MTTIFANVLNIRLTPTELVLEFGSFFPDRMPVGAGAVGPPSDYKPEVRVVLNKAVLPNMAEGLTKAAAQAASQAASTGTTSTGGQEPPKRPVGFTG